MAVKGRLGRWNGRYQRIWSYLRQIGHRRIRARLDSSGSHAALQTRPTVPLQRRCRSGNAYRRRTPRDGWSVARPRWLLQSTMAASQSRKFAATTSCRRKNSYPGNARSKFTVLLVCGLRAFSSIAYDPPEFRRRVAEETGGSRVFRGLILALSIQCDLSLGSRS